MSGTRKPPENYTEIKDPCKEMTNFDNSISPGLEEELRSGKVYCHHAAREFNGDVWYEDGLFHEAVFRYHVFTEHHEAPTLRELMTKVNHEHGWE